MGARPLPGMDMLRRDFDGYDRICDHLLVLDHSRGSGADRVVGTYRLIRREAASRARRVLLGRGIRHRAGSSPIPARFSNSGRSCVDAGYRARPVMQLLWSGIAAYVFHYDIALMFGCASLPGTDPEALATPLSYLYYHHLAPPALRARALPERFVEMRRLRPRADRPEPHARCAAAADQGLSAARRLCRRRRGDRRAVQHDGHLHRRQDRSRDREILAPLRAAIERRHGPPRWAAWIASAPRRCGSGGSALYLAWTVPLMPVQALGLALRRRWVGDVPALLSSLLLPYSRHPGARDRPAGSGTAGAVRGQPRLLSRHHGAGLAARRLVHRQDRGRRLAAVRLAGASCSARCSSTAGRAAPRISATASRRGSPPARR